jgi:AhpD family alkylhydroperoxidase
VDQRTLTDKLEEIRRQRKRAHHELCEQSPVYRAFTEMETAAYAPGALSRQAKELVAIGISVKDDCESCMEWHISQAMKHGASEAEIREAVDVAIAMGGGRATVSARFALAVLEDLRQQCVVRALDGDADHAAALAVIVGAFSTVARDFGLTQESCPAHAAFFTMAGLRQMLAKGAVFLGALVGGELAGCVAVEPSPHREGVFYLEKLAVLPAHRHRSIGVRLTQEVFTYCRAHGGRLVSLALLDTHEVLKQWYAEQGFTWVRAESFPHLPFRVCFMEKPIP